jgi:large subunit ribosomal protein L24
VKILRNDTIVVIAGKDKGKRGVVRQVLPKDGRVVVENVSS